MIEVFEPVTKSSKHVSEEETKTVMVNSEENNKALAKINDKILEILNNRGKFSTYLLSPLSKIADPKHSSQWTSKGSNRTNSSQWFLKKISIAGTLCDNL